MFKLILSFSVVILFSFSCSTPRPSGKTEAEVLYREAQRLKESGRYLLAIEKLNSIRSQYPYSFYATHAELLHADVLYSQENYAEAAAAYIVFKDFHPKHKKMHFVLWRIAEAFYMQLPDTYDRDLTPGHEAIKYYQELFSIFPNSKYVKDSKEKIKQCSEMIEKKEQYIADFYFKTEVFDAARFRYLSILKNIRTKEIREHSIKRVLLSSKELFQPKKCKKYYKRYSNEVAKDYKEELLEILNDCKKSN